MIQRILISLVFVAFVGLPLAAQDREELLSETLYAEGARQPSYVDLSIAEVRGQVAVVAGRTSAFFGFNAPEVRVLLPHCDNSVYAKVDFGEPRLLDQSGAEVGYELERGLYDHEIHADEIRFAPVDGDEPVEHQRAVGTVAVRYPLGIRTHEVRPGQQSSGGPSLSFDGPFVAIRRPASDEDELEAASFCGITAFRAYDDQGRQLKQHSSAGFQMRQGTVTETLAFYGLVAEVRVDVVEEWAKLEIAYDLLAAAALPESQAGTPQKSAMDGARKGGDVDIRIVVEAPPAAAAAPGLPSAEAPPAPSRPVVEAPPASAVEAAPPTLPAVPTMSRAQALGRLKNLGYPEPSVDLYVMSAVKGDVEAVPAFLAVGVPVNAAVADGRTALVSAVRFGHGEVALLLLAAGADSNLTDSNNGTPLLHAAGRCDFTGVVRALLVAGADTTPVTRGGTTAEQMAGIMGCAENQRVIAAAAKR